MLVQDYFRYTCLANMSVLHYVPENGNWAGSAFLFVNLGDEVTYGGHHDTERLEQDWGRHE